MKKFNIPNFPNYELIDFGTNEIVVNKKTGKVIKFSPNGKGYTSVRLNHKNKQYRLLIHKIKWECYNGVDLSLKGHNSLLTIDHIDNVKTNNNINNLRILSRIENTQKRYL